MTKILHSKILGTGAPLLIFHGFLGSGDNWITLGRRFATNFQVHLIDLRNHGRSFHDDEMDFEVMCEDVLAYCEYHQLDAIVIIGHSMGGKVAMYMAVHHSEIIKKLIIVDIAPKSYPHRHGFILEALQAVDFSIHTKRELVHKVLLDHLKNEKYVQFLLKNIYRKTKNSLAFRFNLPVFVEKYGHIVDALPPFSQFEGEILFLRGAQSDYILPEDEALIKAHFPKAQIVEIANSGHWLHAEQPDEFYRISFYFLKENV